MRTYLLPAGAAERIGYGVLVAALENGLVKTLQGAVDALKKFGAPSGAARRAVAEGTRPARLRRDEPPAPVDLHETD